MTSQRTSPPWSGSGTGEYGRRPGGGASEASQETPWSSLAVLRTAPPRHFVPLPQLAGGGIPSGQPAVSPERRPQDRRVRPTAGRGPERRGPCPRRALPGGPAARAPSALRAPPPASWGRNPKRPVGRRPRGAAAERASTAEGREGARAKRAMRHPGVSQRSCGPRPLGTSCHSPSKLGEKSKEASRTSPPWSGSDRGALTMTAQRTAPPWSGSGTGEYGRRPGGGASEASQETPWSFPAVLRTAPPRHFVPLPQQAGGEIQRDQSDLSPVERKRQGGTDDDPQRTSPPWSGSGTGEYGRRPGGGASEASQKTTVSPRRPVRTAPPSTPLAAPWGRNPRRPQDEFPRPEAGRGRERSEPEDHSVSPAAGTDRAPLHSASRSVGEKSTTPSG